MSDQNSKLPDIAYVSELAKLFKRFQLDELEIETGEQRILMRRGEVGSGAVMPVQLAQPVVTAQPLTQSGPTPVAASTLAREAAEEREGAATFITSPFVGTFYSRPRPDSKPFVTIGSTVAAGMTVCIVEAMKLFNEIEAELGCVIEEMLVQDQQPVEFGTKLFRVRPL